jgi:hypothetical protein
MSLSGRVSIGFRGASWASLGRSELSESPLKVRARRSEVVLDRPFGDSQFDGDLRGRAIEQAQFEGSADARWKPKELDADAQDELDRDDLGLGVVAPTSCVLILSEGRRARVAASCSASNRLPGDVLSNHEQPGLDLFRGLTRSAGPAKAQEGLLHDIVDLRAGQADRADNATGYPAVLRPVL